MRKILSIIFLSGLVFSVHAADNKEVVIYTSQDGIFSEPILKDFEAKTGIKVKAVYDVEAAKTVGLINRLIAEKDNPQADVFWNSEICRTIVLKQKGVLVPYASPSAINIPASFKDKDDQWTAFGGRGRIMVYNTDLLKEADAPKSIYDLADPKWNGKFCMANPLFGTAATHAAALYIYLGPDKLRKLLFDFKANNILIVDGNAPSRDRVISGMVPVGYTDTDDATVSIEEGKPIAMIFPDKETIGTLVMPNTVAMIKNCPHPDAAKAFINYLLSEEVESKLLFSGAIQIACRPNVKKPANAMDLNSIKAMDLDWEKVADSIEPSAKIVKETLLK